MTDDPKIARRASYVVGLTLLFLGARFFLAPEVAEQGFGIDVPNGDHFAFHQIKGVRDIATGLACIALARLREHRALGVFILIAAPIPAVDALQVVAEGDRPWWMVMQHAAVVPLALAIGSGLLRQLARVPNGPGEQDK